MDENLVIILAAHPFLTGMDAKLISSIASCASDIRFEKGEFLVREGEAADAFFLLRDGSVTVEVRVPGQGPIRVETLKGGDVLGWSWIVPPFRHRFDARALEPARAVAVDGDCLRRKFDVEHELGYELLRRFSTVIAHRLQATRRQILETGVPPKIERKDAPP